MTAMQELLEHLDDIKDCGSLMKLPPKGCAVIKSVVLTVIKTIELEYIEKEKKQIVEACKEYSPDWILGEEYYEKIKS